MEYTAYWFDGSSSDPREVRIHLTSQGTLVVKEHGQLRAEFPSSAYLYHPPVGESPLRIRLVDSPDLIETAYNPHLANELSKTLASGTQITLIFERHLPLALSSLVAAVIVSILLYLYGLPILARIIHPFVPYHAKSIAGEQILILLDHALFSPSALPTKQQEEIRIWSDKLVQASSLDFSVQIMTRRFLDGEKEVSNALAVLPNTIIVTDGLVQLLTPSEIKGVIAHEIGHLKYDHGTHMLLRSSIISVLSLALFGADPGAIHGLALALINAQYSQDQESAADRFAVELLKRAGEDPLALATALKKMSEGAIETDFERYLSTHPLTSERIEALKQVR